MKSCRKPRVSQSIFATRWGLNPQVSRAEAVGIVYQTGAQTELQIFGECRPGQTPAQDGGWRGETHFQL